jgi:hypothetical protein
MKNEFPIIDRPTSDDPDDHVLVELETGDRYRIFVLNLTDEEYIERARIMKQIEDMRHVRIF